MSNDERTLRNEGPNQSRRHPERNRSSGGAKDLLMNRNARLNRSGFKPRRKRCLKECVFSRTEKLKQSGFSPLRCANMNEHRRQILQMLAEGKISADEAERLIAALETPSSYSTSPDSASISTGKPRPKYLRVLVDAEEGSSGYDGPTRVNVRVPMQ